MTYILLFIGFIILIKGADFLVEGASSLARQFKVSDLVIGLTVVAFGTSSPELFVNIVSSIKGNTDIAIGNVLGSSIANIFLILGVSAVIYPLSVSKGTVWKEIPFSLLAALLLGLLANDHLIDGAGFSTLTRIDGMVLLSFFMIFMYHAFGTANEIRGLDDHVSKKQYRLIKSVASVIFGLVGLSLGSKWIVDCAVQLALYFGLSQSFVGLTIVALGTSLPELATSAVAAFKKNVEIAVGNVVGSNIFNIFLVLGVSATIRPLPFPTRNNFDIGVVVLASVLLFVYMFTGKRLLLDRWEGILFLVLYIGYIAVLVIQG